VAFDDHADSLRAFPKPGAAGQAPTLADLDGDGATEVAAGTAPADSNVYTYDAGTGTWSAALAHWPTPRGDMGRTASHAGGTPPPIVIDRIRPARVTDLEAHAITAVHAQVTFHVTGDDSLSGGPVNVFVRRAPYPLDDQNFDSGIAEAGAPTPSGILATITTEALPVGSTWWFAARIVDDDGNASAVSNSDSVSLPDLRSTPISDLRVLAVTDSSVRLAWTEMGGLTGEPPTDFHVSGSPAPLDSANVDQAPVQMVLPVTRQPGEAETTLVTQLTPGRRWRFVVRSTFVIEGLSRISNIAEAVTSVGGALTGHAGMAVAARPQPAATSVTIDWQGDDSGTVPTSLDVYDLTGRLRRHIALGTEPGGSYNWDGRDGESRLLPAGLYFIRLVSGARHAGSRVVFVR
jgi:hypothetical protein